MIPTNRTMKDQQRRQLPMTFLWTVAVSILFVLVQACSDDYVNPLDTRYRAPEDVYSEQAWQAYAGGNIIQAEQDFEHALSIAPDHAEALGGLGWITLGRMELQTAREYFEHALNSQEQHLPSLLGLASADWIGSKYDSCAHFGEMALEQLEQGSSPHPLLLTSRDIHLMLAQVYYVLSQPEDAFEHLQVVETQDFSPESTDFEQKLLEAIETIQLEN